MSEDTHAVRKDKSEPKDRFIPPPMDPYATYQTPYERRQSPEPNPFIEFRRFADKQFSDIFSGLQAFTDFPNHDRMKDIREKRERLADRIALERERFENEMKPMVEEQTSRFREKPRSTSALTPTTAPAATQNTESVAKPARDGPRDWITATAADGKEWRIDPSTGLAIQKKTEDTTPPPKAQQDDRATRWKRGFRNCPELKKYRGETELDMYETYEDLAKPHRPAASPTKGSPPWSSWLSAYGYDGLQKSKKDAKPSTITAPTQDQNCPARTCDIRPYFFTETWRMDPIKNDHDLMPWIMLSPYSPRLLTDPSMRRLESVTIHNGCLGGCDRPLHMYRHKFRNLSISSDQDIESRTKLAGQARWIDAFEDLLSLERTGKMPDRDLDSPSRPREMSEHWVHDMVEKGLLGPKWSLQDGWLKRDSRDDSKPGVDAIREARARRMLDPVLIAMRDDPDTALAQAFGVKAEKHNSDQGPTPTQEHFDERMVKAINDISAVFLAPLQLEVVRSQASHPSADTPTPSDTQEPPTLATKPMSSVISSLTTTTSRTLPDGSLETKRILKKRFADGNEESEESTEIVYPQISKSASAGDALKEHDKKQGWFWT